MSWFEDKIEKYVPSYDAIDYQEELAPNIEIFEDSVEVVTIELKREEESDGSTKPIECVSC